MITIFHGSHAICLQSIMLKEVHGGKTLTARTRWPEHAGAGGRGMDDFSCEITADPLT